jgi:hypothetical protein
MDGACGLCALCEWVGGLLRLQLLDLFADFLRLIKIPGCHMAGP